MNRLPQKSPSSQSFGKYWQLNQNNQETKRIQTGLVAFYNIWPGNGVGLFFQSRSPHGANMEMENQGSIWLSQVHLAKMAIKTVCVFDSFILFYINSYIDMAFAQLAYFSMVTSQTRTSRFFPEIHPRTTRTKLFKPDAILDGQTTIFIYRCDTLVCHCP